MNKSYYYVEYNQMRVLEVAFYRYQTLLSEVKFMVDNDMDTSLIFNKLHELEKRYIKLELVKSELLNIYVPKSAYASVDYNFEENRIEISNKED